MKKIILVMNAGSSSLKFGIFCKSNENKLLLKKILSGQVARLLSDSPKFTLKDIDGKTAKDQVVIIDSKSDRYIVATRLIIKEIANYDKNLSISATVHRVVHGGDEFKQATLINENILNQLEKFIPLAPLHQPYNLKIADFFYRKINSINHYACFDTAFHQTIDPIGRTYAIPIKYLKVGIKRYGFHGLSYEYITSILADYVGEETANKKWIIAHLGAGASLCSIYNKKSVATTMGFSVLDGLPMATRCGEIDPAIITYLGKEHNLSYEEINNILYNQAGLFGLSGGISGDIKTLMETNNSQAQFAIDVFCHQIVVNIGKMIASAGGCDGIVFTAGVGENSYKIRETIVNKLAWIHAEIDKEKNRGNQVYINSADSIPILVIPTNEEYIMATKAFEDLV